MKFSAALIYIWVLGNMLGCISVNLGGKDESKRAAGVQVTEPTSPFEVDKRMDVDGSWKNHKNGNSISYISDCQDPSDPPLEGIIDGALAGLNELKLESNESPTIQGREARRVMASGKVDGVPSKIDLLVFKRNHCIYILSYVGVQKAFSENFAQFDKFISGFRAP